MMHDKLLNVVRRLDTDYEPYGKAEHEEFDCSSGCRHFVELAGASGRDWGICASPDSPRAGLLTFVHQGCTAFEPIRLDRTLPDAQLRSIIEEASDILKDRRHERMETTAPEVVVMPGERGEFLYDVRTSYFPHIKGHYPTIFRLEQHESGFIGIPLVARIGGKERPTVKGRYPAINGEVFKIVRENGEYSYQVPFSGRLYNLKQHPYLSTLSIQSMEVLRRFLESVESAVFEPIIDYAHGRLSHSKQLLDDTRDQLRRWRNHEFWADEARANKRELREMLQDAKDEAERLPNRIAEEEALAEWLKGIDRSAPNLKSVPPPPTPQRQPRRR